MYRLTWVCYPEAYKYAWFYVSELLPGIENYLSQTLANENLSEEAEELRQYFVERLDILKLPPSRPPRTSGQTLHLLEWHNLYDYPLPATWKHVLNVKYKKYLKEFMLNHLNVLIMKGKFNFFSFTGYVLQHKIYLTSHAGYTSCVFSWLMFCICITKEHF